MFVILHSYQLWLMSDLFSSSARLSQSYQTTQVHNHVIYLQNSSRLCMLRISLLDDFLSAKCFCSNLMQFDTLVSPCFPLVSILETRILHVVSQKGNALCSGFRDPLAWKPEGNMGFPTWKPGGNYMETPGFKKET